MNYDSQENFRFYEEGVWLSLFSGWCMLKYKIFLTKSASIAYAPHKCLLEDIKIFPNYAFPWWYVGRYQFKKCSYAYEIM